MDLRLSCGAAVADSLGRANRALASVRVTPGYQNQKSISPRGALGGKAAQSAAGMHQADLVSWGYN